jgi:acyl dehydratase
MTKDTREPLRVEVGETLPDLVLPPVSRATLAYFAGASGDRNPIHLDIDFAREAGQDDVFAHGMLVMAYAARQLTGWAGPAAVRSLEARFVAITRLYERLTCRSRVSGKGQGDGMALIEVEFEVRNDAGELKLTGRGTLSA